MKAVLILAIALAAISAHAETKPSGTEIASFTRKAKANLVDNFKDPRSVQYRDLFVSRSTLEGANGLLILCGQVNAKNSYGAYIGFRPFYAAEMVLSSVKSDEALAFDVMQDSLCTSKVSAVK